MNMSDAETLTCLLHAIDRLDWAGVRGCLADPIRSDYTELSGGEPETLTADDLVARWQGLLPGFDATQHMTGPVLLITNEHPGVRAEAHVRGYHHLGGETWGVYGHYIARIADGKITELTLQVFYQDGNLDRPAKATQRAATAPRPARGCANGGCRPANATVPGQANS
jgi:hypothetical protein